MEIKNKNEILEKSLSEEQEREAFIKKYKRNMAITAVIIAVVVLVLFYGMLWYFSSPEQEAARQERMAKRFDGALWL